MKIEENNIDLIKNKEDITIKVEEDILPRNRLYESSSKEGNIGEKEEVAVLKLSAYDFKEEGFSNADEIRNAFDKLIIPHWFIDLFASLEDSDDVDERSVSNEKSVEISFANILDTKPEIKEPGRWFGAFSFRVHPGYESQSITK